MSRSFNSFSNGGLSRVKNTAGSKRVSNRIILHKIGLHSNNLLTMLQIHVLWTINWSTLLAKLSNVFSTNIIFLINFFNSFFTQKPHFSIFFIGRRLSSLERSIFFKSVKVLDFLVIKGFTISESNDFTTDLTCQ